MKNYYEILGITSGADRKAIRKAWLSKAKLTHPDHHPDDPTAEELFKEAQEAYRILSDPFLRERYDFGDYAAFTAHADDVSTPVNHYFYSKIDDTNALQYDEMSIRFTYTGRGRIFKKPDFSDFFVTGSPYISHRMITHEGHRLKETTFTYVICPIKTGKLKIGSASIKIGDKVFESEPVTIDVKTNRCHFMKNATADGKPLKLMIHYAVNDDLNTGQLSGTKRNHTVLIPRSKDARFYHMIGMTMKIVFIIWGGVMLKSYAGIPFLLGCIPGGLLGGLNCMIMYRLAGIRSKYRHARKYPTVQEYIAKGYKLGESSGTPMLSGQLFYNVQHLIL